MPFHADKRYELGDVPGGNTDENHQKMKEAVERIMSTNGHLDEDDIADIAKREVFGISKFSRVGGQ